MKHLKKGIVSFVLFAILFFTAAYNNGFNLYLGKTAYAYDNYQLVFSETNNQFSLDEPLETTSTAHTNLGNPIEFSHIGMLNSDGNWGSMSPGAEFHNITPISGLKSISFTFDNSESSVSLYYSWGVFDSEVQTTLSNSNPSFDFNNEGPSYFKILADTDSIIDNFIVNYSCVAQEEPISETDLGHFMFSLINEDTEYEISGYYPSLPARVRIPETYNGLPITSIGEYAFYRCSSLTSILIPNSIISIRDFAFHECSSLSSIIIPSSVTSIGDGAFYYCPSLVSLTISHGVISIGDLAFGMCSYSSIIIPNSVTSIGFGAFYWCPNLTSVTIPNSVTSIGDFAFSGCYRLSYIDVQVDNPNYVSLDGILYDKNITHVINYPLAKSDHSYVIPDSVTSIGFGAFAICTNLTSITIPNSVTSIGEYAFNQCSSLTSIVIPSSVTSIGNNAFQGCSSLTSIVIPSSVTSIGNNAFERCSSLTSIVIPSSVTSIGNNAFQGCSSLTSIVIPSSVTSIGENAFSDCESLTSIVIPNSVTSIGENAFKYCKSLTIYVEASSKPSGWNSYWNSSNRPVIWGYTG